MPWKLAEPLPGWPGVQSAPTAEPHPAGPAIGTREASCPSGSGDSARRKLRPLVSSDPRVRGRGAPGRRVGRDCERRRLERRVRRGSALPRCKGPPLRRSTAASRALRPGDPRRVGSARDRCDRDRPDRRSRREETRRVAAGPVPRPSSCRPALRAGSRSERPRRYSEDASGSRRRRPSARVQGTFWHRVRSR